LPDNDPTDIWVHSIIPWAENEKERLNPRNGLCLSPLYDICFDKGYIGITSDYQIVLSRELKHNFQKDYFIRQFGYLEDRQIDLPDRFLPDPDFLDYHHRTIFRE
jgi:putative restriction endonuclease